jgi:hypothetical protein
MVTDLHASRQPHFTMLHLNDQLDVRLAFFLASAVEWKQLIAYRLHLSLFGFHLLQSDCTWIFVLNQSHLKLREQADLHFSWNINLVLFQVETWGAKSRHAQSEAIATHAFALHHRAY